MSDEVRDRGRAGDDPEMATGGSMLRDLAPAALMLVLGLLGLVAAPFLTAKGDGHYLVIARPGASLGETLALVGAAHGGLVETGGFGNIVIAASAEDGFPARLKAAGAWVVLNAPAQLGCYGDTTRETRS